MIGLGGGVALESIPPSVREIDVIELEPEVLRANRVIAELRDHDPLADPRVRIHINDARGAMQATDARWDAVVSQPSHPWTAGASHLYTREFHQLVKSRLTPGGVFVQWIGEGFVDDSLFRSLSATLLSSFSHVRAYETGGFLFLASDAPLATPEQEAALIAAQPEAFAKLGARVEEDLAAMLVLDEIALRRISEGQPLIEDDDNLLANRSPLLVMQDAQDSVSTLLQRHDPLLVTLGQFDGAYLLRRLVQMGNTKRARGLLNSMGKVGNHAGAWSELNRGPHRAPERIAAFERALARDPGLEDIRYRLVATRSNGDPSEAEGLNAGSRATVRGFQLSRRGQWKDVEELDSILASVPPIHPAFAQALRLRIGWRLHVEGPSSKTRAEEALALLETQAYGWGPVRHGQRALAAALSGKKDEAISSLWEFANLTARPNPSTARASVDALAALDLLQPDELSAAERVKLSGKIRTFASHGLGATQ